MAANGQPVRAVMELDAINASVATNMIALYATAEAALAQKLKCQLLKKS